VMRDTHESGGNNQCDDRNCHQGRIELGSHWLEFLRAEPESTDCETKESCEWRCTGSVSIIMKDDVPIKAIPKTSNILLSKPPRRELWTRARSHLPRAIPAIISSTTFPKVAFNSPPTAWLVLNAICSVPRPKRAARGTIARAETTKMAVSDW